MNEIADCSLLCNFEHFFPECLCYISKCSVLTCCLLTGVHVAEIQQWYNLSFAHFSGMFSHEFANVYDFRNVSTIFAASSGTSQSYIQMRSSDERTGGKFREQSYSRFACFRVFVRTIFANVCDFSQHYIDYSLPSEILAALHTNKSSSSVDTHLAGIIRAHLGYFAMFDISLTDSDPCIHGKTREHFFR